MKLLIELTLDNAAFAESGPEEVGRILADLVDRLPVPLGAVDLGLRDVNGNRVGHARISGKAVAHGHRS